MTMPKFEPVAWLRDTLDGGLSTMTDCCTNVVKEIWLKANPKNVERYTAPLYTLDQLTKAYEAGKRDAIPEADRLSDENDQLREQVAMLRWALADIANDYSDRFDMDSSSTNPGIKVVVKQAIKALAATEPNERMTEMEVTEFTDEDAADVGRALIKAIEMHAYPGWGPAQCPSEIVGDLRNECDELKAKLDGAAKVVFALVQVARAAWNAADNGLGVLVDNGTELRVSPVDFDAISDALGLLDMLPDDKPGFTLNGPARAEWALRNLLCSA